MLGPDVGCPAGGAWVDWVVDGKDDGKFEKNESNVAVGSLFPLISVCSSSLLGLLDGLAFLFSVILVCGAVGGGWLPWPSTISWTLVRSNPSTLF